MNLGDLGTLAGVVAAVVLGIISLVLAAHANSSASAGNRLASESNEIANRATEAAERATQATERAEIRGTERNDVVWRTDLTSESWTIHNVGQDVACGVIVALSVDGVDHLLQEDEIGSGGHVSHDVSSEMNRTRARRRATVESMHRSGIMYGAGDPSLTIGYRVVWQTPGGVSHRAAQEPVRMKF